MDPPSGPKDQTTAQPLWPQAPIQESLICLTDEDMNRQAVESFQGEWPQYPGSLCLWCLGPRRLVAFSLSWPTQGGSLVVPVTHSLTHFCSHQRARALCGVRAGKQQWVRLARHCV